METDSVIKTIENGKISFTFNYTLKYDEAHRAFIELTNKFGNGIRYSTIILVSFVTVALLYFQYKTPTALYYSVVALLGIILLFVLIYGPLAKARKGARAVERAGGKFEFTLNDQGSIILEEMGIKTTIPLAGDKDSRVAETDELFVIRPDRNHSLCLPKRILNEEMNTVQSILVNNASTYQRRKRMNRKNKKECKQ